MRVASRALTLGLWTQIWGKHPPLMASLGLTSIPVGDSNGGGVLGWVSTASLVRVGSSSGERL